MIKLRIEATPEEIDRFSTFFESLSRIEILNASGNYQNARGKSKYARRYLDVELKPLGTVEEQDRQALIDVTHIYDGLKERHPLNTRVKPGIDIQKLVYDTYPETCQALLLWFLDWSDIDGVLDYLYGVKVTHPSIPQVKDIIELIEKNCEKL